MRSLPVLLAWRMGLSISPFRLIVTQIYKRRTVPADSADLGYPINEKISHRGVHVLI